MTTETAYEFVMREGRLPRVDLGERPWEYVGWLRMLVQQAGAQHPGVPDRWGYLFRMIESGALPVDPIPAIKFADMAPSAGTKVLERGVSIVQQEVGSWRAMESLIDYIAFAVGVRGAELPRLSDGVFEQLYRDLNFDHWVLEPYDYLGAFIAENMGGGPHAFYPTPMGLVRAMVAMTLDGERDARLLTVCDPAVGTGRFLLEASNYSLFLFGQDIDATMVRCCMINGMFYAPWLCYPPPKPASKRRKVLPPPITVGRGKIKPPPLGER